ncbi:MAG TPA: transglutaminaseTgpA domain-containing protein [Candidatus Limnocylindrales bacterium]|jgi:transglutaminase-like putative cysteine protease
MTELRPRRPDEGWLTLGLLVVMMIVLAEAIDDPAYVNGKSTLTDGLVWCALGGLAIGFIGPKVGWSRWTTHGIGALFAGLIIPIIAGFAIKPGASIGGAFDASAVGVVKAYFDTVWLGNQYTTEEVHFIIALGAIVWATGQFAGYAVFGHRRPLNAVLMSGIILLTSMSVTFNKQLPYLVVFTGAALFLLIEMHAFDERATWVRRRIGDPATISSLYLRGGTVFILAAMLGSLVLTARAQSSPLAGAWAPVHEQLIEMGETIGRLLPVGGNVRGDGVAFGAIAKIGAKWFGSDDPVFTAVLPPGEKADDIYWRAITYNQFLLGAWNNSTGDEKDVDAGSPLLDGSEEELDPALSRSIEVTVRPTSFLSDNLITPGTPVKVNAGAVVSLTGEDGWYQTAEVQGNPAQYTVDAQLLKQGDTDAISGHKLEADTTNYPAEVTDLYTDVPEGAVGPDAEKLLRDVIAYAGGTTNPYDLAAAMDEYLRSSRFKYSIDLTDQQCDASAVECFARTKTGYCMHYASTMAILLRLANPQNPIPTRLVEGFLPSTPVGGVVTVTARAAHAWVEVYFPSYGWIRFDPTGGSVGRPSEIKPGPAVSPLPSSSFGPASTDRDFPNRPGFSIGPTTGGTTGGGSNQVGDRAVFALLAGLVALFVGALAFAAWLRGPRGEVTPDRAWQSMARAAGRFGFGPRPNQTIYEYATTLGELVPVAKTDLATVAAAKVETNYARVRLGGDRLHEVGAATRRLRISLLRLLFQRKSRRKRPRQGL